MSGFQRRRADLLTAAVGLAVVVACSVVASQPSVPQMERDVFHLVNGLPDWAWWIAYPLQTLGVLVVPVLLATVAALLRRPRLALALAVLPLLKLAVEYGAIKRVVQRDRPFTSVCAQDPACGVFRDVPLYGPSFVSGHAVVAGAVAVILLPYVRRRGIAVLVALLAVGVAVGRVYLGAHNPLDVVGGLALGAAVGSVLNFAVGVPAAGNAPDRAAHGAGADA